MKAKTFEAQYELTDFNLYMDNSNDNNEVVTVVDFVVENDNLDFIEKEFNNIFIIETDKTTYLFSDYKLIECYSIGEGLIRVICVK
jgi:hypothetical protein